MLSPPSFVSETQSHCQFLLLSSAPLTGANSNTSYYDPDSEHSRQRGPRGPRCDPSTTRAQDGPQTACELSTGAAASEASLTTAGGGPGPAPCLSAPALTQWPPCYYLQLPGKCITGITLPAFIQKDEQLTLSLAVCGSTEFHHYLKSLII